EPPLRYLELLTPADPTNPTRKPHLLTRVDNNLGGRVDIEYTPSTAFFLADQAAGRPWASVLPFPVQCVSRVTTRDAWRRTAYTTPYPYHHGCYDGPTRELRPFGRVEQTDTEAFGTFTAANADSPFVTDNPSLHQPPTRVITWYHTGIDTPAVEAEY